MTVVSCYSQGWGVAVLVGVPTKDAEFRTHPMNFLDERTLKGTFFGNYKPHTDLPLVIEKYMNKVKIKNFLILKYVFFFLEDFLEIC